MPLAPWSREGSSPNPSRRGPRSLAASSQASSAPALVPSLGRVRLELVAASATPFRCARHAVVAAVPSPGAASALRCPGLDRTLIRRSSAAIPCFEFLRNTNIAAGPLAELPAIELSIREHDRSRSKPRRFRDGRLLIAGLRASMLGAGPLSLPGGWSPSSPLARRRRQPLATPTRSFAQTPCVASW